MKLNCLRTIVFGCLLLVAFALPAWAKFEVHPRLSVQEEYNDNLYNSNTNEQEEWITTIAPGISLNYDGRSIDLVVDYSLDFQFYKNNSDENQNNFKDIQRANATANFFSGRPFTLLISESISRETLDSRESTAEVNKSTVYSTTVTPRYRLQVSESFSLLFGYSYSRTDYVAAAGDDTEEHSGTFSLVKKLSTNTEISANYAYIFHPSDVEDEYTEQTYTLGLNQQLGPRSKLRLEGGFSTVEFETGLDDQTTNWLVDLSYRMTAPLTLSLVYSQDFAVSASNGLTKLRDASLMVAYVKESLTGSVALFWQTTDYVRQLREDQSYGSRFNLGFPLGRALSTSFNAEYEKAEYTDVTDEEVDRYRLGASINYEFSRFLTSLAYRYSLNDSDTDSSDYTNNTVTLRVTLRF